MASSGLFGNSSLAPLYGVLVLVVLSGGFFLLSSEVATLREALLQSSARGSSYENNGGGDERQQQQQQQPATKIEYLRPLNPGSDLEKLLRQERFHRSVWPDRLKLFTVDDVMLEWYARSTWSCPSAELIGEPGRADGPKWMCTEEMDAAAGDDCLVYGVGIDGEVGWDVNIRQRWPQCEVHAFEINPTGGADVVAAMKANNITAHYGFRFHDLEAHMRDLGHSGRRLAAMKMDIEGAEFELFEKLFSNKEKRWSDVIGQLALELHATRAQHQRAFSFFKEMERQGFRVFAYEANGPDCAEIGWVTNHRADLLLQDMGETNGKKKE